MGLRTAGAALVVLVALLTLAASCRSGAETGVAGCPSGSVVAEPPFAEVVAELTERVAALRASLAVACAHIARDLGASGVPDVGDGTGLSAPQVDQLCQQASTAIEQAMGAGGAISVAVVGGLCLIDLEAQRACELGCLPGEGCPAGDPITRCPPDALWATCPAECSGACLGEPGSPVPCQGECSGTCTGSCSGACGEPCADSCEGTCTGECEGVCSITPPSATCPGLCNGGCSMQLTQPGCAQPLGPAEPCVPEDCECICTARTALAADCRPPRLLVEGDGALKDTLEQNLPAILLLQMQCALLGETGCLSALLSDAAPACAEQHGGGLGQAAADLAVLCSDVTVVVPLPTG